MIMSIVDTGKEIPVCIKIRVKYYLVVSYQFILFVRPNN